MIEKNQKIPDAKKGTAVRVADEARRADDAKLAREERTQQQARHLEEQRLAREERRQREAAQAEERAAAREERKQEQSAWAAERLTQSRLADRRHALLTAATSLGPGATLQQLYERANELLAWIKADS